VTAHTDEAIFLLERELLVLDRAINFASLNGSPIDDEILGHRNAIAARIFKIPATTFTGLAAQARVFEIEYKNELTLLEDCELDFSLMGGVLAEGIARVLNSA
jgi:hypothetical protein